MYYIDICYMLYTDDQKVFFGIYIDFQLTNIHLK